MSQGGFNFGNGVRAPDVAFTPSDIYRGLDEYQRRTFQGEVFSPTFVVRSRTPRKLNELTDKFKTTNFPAGVQLGIYYVFKTGSDNVVRRRYHARYGAGHPTVVDSRDVLPVFKLQLWKIDEAISQVRLSYYLLPCKRPDLD